MPYIIRCIPRNMAYEQYDVNFFIFYQSRRLTGPGFLPLTREIRRKLSVRTLISTSFLGSKGAPLPIVRGRIVAGLLITLLRLFCSRPSHYAKACLSRCFVGVFQGGWTSSSSPKYIIIIGFRSRVYEAVLLLNNGDESAG